MEMRQVLLPQDKQRVMWRTEPVTVVGSKVEVHIRTDHQGPGTHLIVSPDDVRPLPTADKVDGRLPVIHRMPSHERFAFARQYVGHRVHIQLRDRREISGTVVTVAFMGGMTTDLVVIQRKERVDQAISLAQVRHISTEPFGLNGEAADNERAAK